MARRGSRRARSVPRPAAVPRGPLWTTPPRGSRLRSAGSRVGKTASTPKNPGLAARAAPERATPKRDCGGGGARASLAVDPRPRVTLGRPPDSKYRAVPALRRHYNNSYAALAYPFARSYHTSGRHITISKLSDDEVVRKSSAVNRNGAKVTTYMKTDADLQTKRQVTS